MADGTDPFPKLGSVYKVSGSKVNQLNQNAVNIKLKSESSGDSKVNSWQSRSVSRGSAPRPWYPQNNCSKPWGQPNVMGRLTKWGNGESGVAKGNSSCSSLNNLTSNGKGALNDNMPAQSTIISTVEKGSNLSVRVDSTPFWYCKNGQCQNEIITEPQYIVDSENNDDEIVDSESDVVFDSDDDLSMDDTDSDTGEKTHESRKKSKWFRAFFDVLDRLTNEEINSQEGQWHCPACRGGTGAIDWYQGLQPLMNHARTVKARRARLHRLFAEVLEDEFHRRRASITTTSEAYGRWEGLDKQVKDHQIVWPPIVVIMNTRYEQDENNKWTGMGNQELLDCFTEYAALKARHSYGPQGHQGMSVLIFESSAAGYLEAARLHKHFKEQGRDREAWNHCRTPFVSGGKRQLFGYLASREDVDIFNKHSGGKSKLKFEMKSYQEMVESRIKQINDDSQQLDYFKKKVAKEHSKSQALADSLEKVSQKLRQTTEENRVVRERTKIQHEQNKEEMDAQEKFFQDQIQFIQQALDAREDNFEKLQQEKREKMKQACGDSSDRVNDQHSVEKISSLIRLQDKEIRQFESEREKLVKIHHDKKLALKKKQFQEELDLEQEFANELTELMDKYTSSLSLEENGRN